MGIVERFGQFIENIALTDAQATAGSERRARVVETLNARYWGRRSPSDNSMFVGSRGKLTSVRPPRDVDVVFRLPHEVHGRFAARGGNKQSRLLQEIRNVLEDTFLTTSAIRGDGPVVQIPFSAFRVELIPGFQQRDGSFLVCFTRDGGFYKAADYIAEAEAVERSDLASNGQTRELIRMMKTWQNHCRVPMKSFWLELLAIEFLDRWEHRGRSRRFHDYMVRDFLTHLTNRSDDVVIAPGVGERLALGDGWRPKAEAARRHAAEACSRETIDPAAAGEAWRRIFGPSMPMLA